MKDFQEFIAEASRLINKKRKLTAAQNLIRRAAAAKPCEILRNDETYAYAVALVLETQFPDVKKDWLVSQDPAALLVMKDLCETADMVAALAVQRVNEHNGATRNKESAHLRTMRQEPDAMTPDDWRHF